MKSLISLCFFVLLSMQLTEAVKTVKNKASNTSQVATTTKKPFLPGVRLPCACIEGECGCCTGVILDTFNQKACLNMSYDPEDFSITAMMSMNGRVMFRRSVSGKNPPPMCIRVPRLPFIRLCVTFSNIYFASRNVHMCIDMEANWDQITLVEWSFDCIRMGASGVAVIGPEEGGGLPPNPIDVIDQTDEDYDDSARNLQRHSNAVKLLQNNIIVFDQSLDHVRQFDKSLIQINKLRNGDVVLAYGTNKTLALPP